ncbi:stage IV sporulation protein FB [Sporosarcina luteola]|nr:stage IV sporulation protein FB [Sporosarcina luteola]
MRIKLHPILLPFFVFLAFTGGVSLYALIFLSLLIHEAGHVVAAKWTGMRVRSCTLLPYGGELFISNRHLYPKKARIMVALGGPIATALLLAISSFHSMPGSDELKRIQLAILLVNLLPILPLDGGQALCTLLERKEKRQQSKSLFLMASILMLLLSLAILAVGFPDTILYMSLAVFLLMQNMYSFRYRKYEYAYERLTEKQLT